MRWNASYRNIGLGIILFFAAQIIVAQEAIQFQALSDGRGFQLGVYQADTATRLGFAGTSDFPGISLLLESSDNRTLIELKANRMGNVANIGVWADLVADAKSWPVYLVALHNTGSSPALVRLNMVFDIPERGDYPRIFSEANQINSETTLSASQGLSFRLENGAVPIIGSLPPNFNARVLYPESFVVANTRRLLASDPLFQFQGGRNFSYVPFSINDRGVLISYPETTLLVGEVAWFVLVFGDDRNPERLKRSLAYTEAALTERQISVELMLKKNTAPLKRNETALERINQILETIKKAQASGGLDMAKMEALYAELESLGAGQTP